MKKRQTLAAAIITYNEEEKIQDCLDSVTEFVDEIIVLDSFSTDDTRDICLKNPKVKFFQHAFDDYKRQKNRAAEMCSTDWVLSLDADERVSPKLRRSILAFLENKPDAVGAKFPRLTRYMHRDIHHGGWYPHKRYRLFKKGSAHWEGDDLHERLILDGKGLCLAGDLIHLTVKDLSDHVNNINKFSSIVALARYNQGRNFHCFRLLWKPVSKFVEMYLLKLGCLDGMQGFIIAIISAYSAFLKEAKLFELSVLGSDKPSNLSGLYQKKR